MRQGHHESLHAYVSRWECTLFEAGSQHFSDHVGRPAQRVQNTTGPRRVASCLRGPYGTPLGVRRSAQLPRPYNLRHNSQMATLWTSGKNSVGVSNLGLGAASEKEEEFDWGD
ncbi:hypothetical protein E4U40_008053 [Claviceps sp. LM458 group G5]|nr:hypothetical protein E4U40_008053 [Claviceps sp. LM458 group G5]